MPFVVTSESFPIKITLAADSLEEAAEELRTLCEQEQPVFIQSDDGTTGLAINFLLIPTMIIEDDSGEDDSGEDD